MRQDLLRHAIPTGDLSVIVDRALKVLVRELEQQKFAATNRPRTILAVAQRRSRHIPADVRRRVWARDGGQCAFAGIHGRRTERGFLEFHHVEPYGDGGESVVDNLELRCRPHNMYETERWEGPLFAREASHVYSVQDRGPRKSCLRDLLDRRSLTPFVRRSRRVIDPSIVQHSGHRPTAC
jgi:hypothetical protein